MATTNMAVYLGSFSVDALVRQSLRNAFRDIAILRIAFALVFTSERLIR